MVEKQHTDDPGLPVARMPVMHLGTQSDLCLSMIVMCVKLCLIMYYYYNYDALPYRVILTSCQQPIRLWMKQQVVCE